MTLSSSLTSFSNQRRGGRRHTEALSPMAEDQSAVAKTFPVKPKLKPTSKKPVTTAEAKYWRSFKPQPTETLSNSVTSLCFSPTSPHGFAASHSASLTIFNSQTLESKVISSAFPDFATSVSYRSDGRLLAAGSHAGVVKVFDVKSRNALRTLRGHARPVHTVRYPRIDKLHLFTGGDDAVVKYWDVATEKHIVQLLGHKDYIRCGDGSPVSDEMFLTGSYDHTVRLWDVRASKGGSVMELNHGKNLVEDVVYLPSGGLIATASGNEVKIWDLIGGGKLLYTMESHNKTVTSICVGKIGKESGEEAQQYRILSVSLDGFMKVFDYAKFKVTHSMRFPSPLLSIAVSPDCSTRVIGTPNGTLYVGKRKMKENSASVAGKLEGLGPISAPPKRVLTPAYFRYFYRGQNEKPTRGDFLVTRPKKVKLTEHDKLLKKFRHKEAFVSALMGKNPENVVAVMEELVARKKLLKCVSNLETDELGLLLGFLQRYSTMPRYASLLLKLGKKVIEMRGEDVKGSDVMKSHIRNLKRSVEEEIRIQQSLQEIQGVISPLLRIAGRR